MIFSGELKINENKRIEQKKFFFPKNFPKIFFSKFFLSFFLPSGRENYFRTTLNYFTPLQLLWTNYLQLTTLNYVVELC